MPRRKPQTGPKTVAKRVVTAELTDEALRLRVQRLSIREIAKRLDRSIGWVSEAINRAINDIPAEGVELLRQVEGEALNASAMQIGQIIDAHLPGALSGSIAKAEMIVKASAALTAISAQRAKLFALNVKEQTEAMPVGTTPLDIRVIYADTTAGPLPCP